MKGFFRWACLLALLCSPVACLGPGGSLDKPGTLFLRDRIGDFQTFRAAFLGQAPGLKAGGFSAYSLHRDLGDPHRLILTLKCSDLGKGLAFVRSPGFLEALGQAGAGIPSLWYGLDVTGRAYAATPKAAGGIVIARNEVRSFKFWETCFRNESHNHPGRRYKNSNYSIHELPGNPEVAIVVHEASDVSKAPAFMNSPALRGEMEATGVVGLDVWYGVNLEEGLF